MFGSKHIDCLITVSERKVDTGGRLEDFELGALLGRGSYACVYEARSRHTGQRVALKVALRPPSQRAVHIAGGAPPKSNALRPSSRC
jgi:serine/threonine protein kinase